MKYFDNDAITVRDMRIEDAQIFTESEIAQGWLNATTEKLETRIRDVRDGKAVSIVAEYYGNPAGYVSVYPESMWGALGGKGYPEIVDFNVLEKYRRNGIGSKLMDVAEQIAFQYCDTVYLGVGLHSGYGSAQRMYIKRGYIPDGSGVWYDDKVLPEQDDCKNDDDLNLYLYKTRSGDLDTLTKLSMELQAISQSGLFYTKDVYDKERFERIRDISAELMALKTELPFEKVKSLFCCEEGYQTPKLDTRAVIFKEDKLLLVKEKGKWALPGGWQDYNESVASNTAKEAKEEAGLDVVPVKVIAIQRRNNYNFPKYAYEICKIFVLCEVVGGSFQENIETTESGYFALDELPELDEDKNVYEQIKMCFDAHADENWDVVFD